MLKLADLGIYFVDFIQIVSPNLYYRTDFAKEKHMK